MITNVVDFGDSLAKDVMVPRIDMAFANADFTYDELVQAFSEENIPECQYILNLAIM